ncbi:DUF3140 domain-containing protein [Hymenobacter sp. PAMC 26628]|uniref:DUF3140 domain-containing protein n=1 Tax=Hymenobacter sp. PAMC 26628 TaxID=1484118 RepID=UPI00076FFA6C|nr:DUF3140 domain-containing protein [Hymenobacter sp. PAMC 26628]AMJ67721.1 DNA-binding protein [Hymenobacter sp. PAMC 26628]
MATKIPADDLYRTFHEEVNMTASELEKWLKSDESKSVGQADNGGESIGHQSGKRIVDILHKKKDGISPDDEAHMHKVHSYIARHSAQRPSGDVAHTPWRYSLMNWGHDPLKK